MIDVDDWSSRAEVLPSFLGCKRRSPERVIGEGVLLISSRFFFHLLGHVVQNGHRHQWCHPPEDEQEVQEGEEESRAQEHEECCEDDDFSDRCIGKVIQFSSDVRPFSLGVVCCVLHLLSDPILLIYVSRVFPELLVPPSEFPAHLIFPVYSTPYTSRFFFQLHVFELCFSFQTFCFPIQFILSCELLRFAFGIVGCFLPSLLWISCVGTHPHVSLPSPRLDFPDRHGQVQLHRDVHCASPRSGLRRVHTHTHTHTRPLEEDRPRRPPSQSHPGAQLHAHGGWW